jgi:hypothetical protein
MSIEKPATRSARPCEGPRMTDEEFEQAKQELGEHLKAGMEAQIAAGKDDEEDLVSDENFKGGANEEPRELERETMDPLERHNIRTARKRGPDTKRIMTFNDLKKTYTHDELSYFPGDNELRFRAFSPILENLFENKIVYCERFIGLVRLENIQITPEFFGATAVPYLPIERKGRITTPLPVDPWTFRGRWTSLRLTGNSLNVPYAGRTIWPEAERVKAVERLIRNDDHEEALRLTLNEAVVD